MGLEFIRDVIYGLKIDMGLPIVLVSISDTAIDQQTGVRTKTLTTKSVSKAILLPENQRLSFMRSAKSSTQSKEGGMELKGRHVLLDKADLGNQVINDIDTFVQYGGRYYKVLAVEDYTYAYDLTINNVGTMAP